MTPQLRFPEFTDEWQVKRLGDIVRFGRGGALSKDELDDVGKYSAIHYGQLFTEYNEIISKVVSKTNVNTGKTSEVGDILMPTSDVTPQGLARASVINENGVMLGGDINVLKPNSFMSSSFMSYMINSQKKKIMRLVSGTTVRHVYASEVSKALYRFPSKPEQEKIADFLTAVDERIAVGEKKLELLETYKRGVMQKIFSQQVRFKDENGSSFPDWEEKKLGEVFNCVKGTGLSREQITDTGLNKCILYGELYTKYGEVIENVISRTNSNAGISSKSNDLLLPCSTTTTGIDLANATALNEADVQLGGDISVLRFKKSGSNIFYAYYLSHFMKQKLASYGQGSTIVHMYFSHFKNMIVVEPSIEEQQKIANFLTTLDNKIKLEEARLASVKEFKKALLQRMFV